MKSELRAKIDEFGKKKQVLLEKVATLSHETLNARPIEGKWSILEIVEHLVNAEKDVLQGLPEYSKLVGKAQSYKNGLTYRAVLFVLKFGIPVKAPSEKMLPVGDVSLAQICKRWDQSQKWFKEYIEGLDEEGLKRAVFFHPVAGPVNPEQAVIMSIAHIDTHTRQIKRRLEMLS